MPGSSPAGKTWITERLGSEKPERVLDIGPGCGTYARRFREQWAGAHWTAVEAWEPYVERYGLREWYDNVIIDDARTWVPDGRYDIAFLGDVLEHMTPEEASTLLDRMRAIGEVVVVSLPIVHYPQGALGGNPYEVHVEEDWTHEKVCALLGEPTEFVNDGEIGAYIYRRTVKPLRTAVYAIAKNEVAFAEKWAASARDSDYLVVCDTGSSDGTQAALRAAGVTVHDIHVSPWRFDVARNASLALLPKDVDYCVALDLDEILVGDWMGALEEARSAGWTRPQYHYVWSWNPDGSEGLTYDGDKIHARYGYRWRHPVHETLTPYFCEEKRGRLDSFQIHHHPDSNKAPPQYLPLLKLSVEEDPHDDRNAHYYARELFYGKDFVKAAEQFKRHLALPSATWTPERAESMRYLAQCPEPPKEIEWLDKAVAEAPGMREPLVALADARRKRGEWVECYDAATKALAITERPGTYLNQPEAWGKGPHDNAALASYYLGRAAEAVEHGTNALALDPTDERLRQNLSFYRQLSGESSES